jgi:cyclin B
MRHSQNIKHSISNFSTDRSSEINQIELKDKNNVHINIEDNNIINEDKNKIIEKLNENIDKTKIKETISPKNVSISINYEEQKQNENKKIEEEKKEEEKEEEIKEEEKKEEKEKLKPIKIEDKYEGMYFKKVENENIQIPIEYIDTIYYNLLLEEENGIESKAEYNYMKNQNEINEQMRSILIDWIIDVHHKFNFTDETLFMTTSIIDRFLTCKKITRSKLQLLGVTALMISCKHEEIDLPKADDFIYITDNAYNREQVFKMENDILHTLNFSLLFPSPIKFFELLSYNFKFHKKQFYMGKYLMESFLIDIKNIKYKSSIISCACTYIVMKFFKMNNYHESYSKKWFLLNEKNPIPNGLSVKECAKDICLFVDNIHKSNYSSTEKKYSKPEFEKVALLILGK